MDGIEKIIDRISSDAQREIDDVLAAAQAEAEKITAEYQAQAKAEADDILARGEKAAAERGERLASVAQLECRKEVLRAKQEVIDEAFQLAMDKLVALCKEQLGWKNSTTYTVIKRLAQRGVLKNEDTVVTSLVSKDQVQAAEIDELVETKFEGSLPAFVAAFTRHQKMTQKEIDQVQAMIDQFRKGNGP